MRYVRYVVNQHKYPETDLFLSRDEIDDLTRPFQEMHENERKMRERWLAPKVIDKQIESIDEAIQALDIADIENAEIVGKLPGEFFEASLRNRVCLSQMKRFYMEL